MMAWYHPADLLIRSYYWWIPFTCVGLRLDRPLLVFHVACYKLLHLVVMQLRLILKFKPVVYANIINFHIVQVHLLF
jgi:hypothetical protein